MKKDKRLYDGHYYWCNYVDNCGLYVNCPRIYRYEKKNNEGRFWDAFGFDPWHPKNIQIIQRIGNKPEKEKK